MTIPAFDVIVLGVGGVGSAALDQLARRGLRVLGLDRFPPGHDRGSSHGRTRLIRQAYFEHPDYVPLLRRAYELWADLSARSGKTLYHQVGVLQAGRPNGTVVPGVLASARQHGLDVEELSEGEITARFPGLRVPPPLVAVFERRAGYLDVEDCVREAARQAVDHGAQLQVGESVRGWKVEGSGVAVETDRGTYRANSLIVSAGAWAGTLLADLGIRFQVVRKSLYWYAAPERLYSPAHGFPGFLYETDRGSFYGFPRIDDEGLKSAEHSGGIPVSDPLRVDRNPDPGETFRVEQFLAEYLPDVTREPLRFGTCLYTLSPDGHFVVDRHPEHPQVVFAAGLSGHGFKFATVLGEVLADLAEHGSTRLPIGFLSCQRSALAASQLS
jgi:sarcosine oxidase